MNLRRISIALGAGLAVLGSAGLANAQGMGGMGMGGMGGMGSGGQGSSVPWQDRAAPRGHAVTSAGKVRSIDRADGLLTLRHASIPSIGMPAMTMTIAADPELLAGIKAGDTVSFIMGEIDGRYELTGVEPLR